MITQSNRIRISILDHSFRIHPERSEKDHGAKDGQGRYYQASHKYFDSAFSVCHFSALSVSLLGDTVAKAKPTLIRCQGVLMNYLIIYLVQSVN